MHPFFPPQMRILSEFHSFALPARNSACASSRDKALAFVQKCLQFCLLLLFFVVVVCFVLFYFIYFFIFVFSALQKKLFECNSIGNQFVWNTLATNAMLWSANRLLWPWTMLSYIILRPTTRRAPTLCVDSCWELNQGRSSILVSGARGP